MSFGLLGPLFHTVSTIGSDPTRRHHPQPEAAPHAAAQPHGGNAESSGLFGHLSAVLGGTSAVHTPHLDAGQKHARDTVKISTVVDRRDQLESRLDVSRQSTVHDAQTLLAEGRAKKTEHNTTAHGDANHAAINQTDAHGNITNSTLVSKGKDGSYTIETTKYEQVGGKTMAVTTRNTAGAGSDGEFTTTTVAQPGRPSKVAPSPIDANALEHDARPGVAYQRTTLKHDGDGNLVSDQVTEANGAAHGSTSTFSREDHIGGTNTYKDHFSDGGVDKLDVKRYDFDNSGANYTHQVTESQGSGADGVQETSTVGHKLGDAKNKDPKSIADLESVRQYNQALDHLPGGDGGENNYNKHKMWLVEETRGNANGGEYQSERTVEGSDADWITKRRATGRTVTEEQRGSWIGSDGHVRDIGIDANSSIQAPGDTYNQHPLTSRIQFGRDGRIDHLATANTDADNNFHSETFDRTRTAHGENTHLKYIDQPGDDGEIGRYAQTVEEDQNVRNTAHGPQLTSASESIQNADELNGGETTGYSEASIHRGHRTLTVDGHDATRQDSYNQLTPAQRALADHTNGALGNQIVQFAGSRGVDLSDGIANPHVAAAHPEGEHEHGALPSWHEAIVGAGLQGLEPELTQTTVPHGGNMVPISLADRTKAFQSEGGNLFEKAKAFRTPDAAVTAPSTDPAAAARYQRNVAGFSTALSGLGALNATQQLWGAIGSGNAKESLNAGASVLANGSELVAGGLETTNALRSLKAPLKEGDSLVGAAGRAAKIADGIGFGAGLVSGGLDISNGIAHHNGFDIARGGVTIATTVGAPLAGEFAAGLATGSLAGPVGFLGAAAVGGIGYGVTKGIDAVEDKDHSIPDPHIDKFYSGGG